MKSRFISRRLVGSLMLSMAGVFALSALPAQAQAATQEEAVVKQLQKEILQCPEDLKKIGKKLSKQLKQIGFRESFRADVASLYSRVLVVMERENPVSFLGQPTKKFILYDWEDYDVEGLEIVVVLPKSSFDTAKNAVKKYQQQNHYSSGVNDVEVSQEDDGVYVSCFSSIVIF